MPECHRNEKLFFMNENLEIMNEDQFVHHRVHCSECDGTLHVECFVVLDKLSNWEHAGIVLKI